MVDITSWACQRPAPSERGEDFMCGVCGLVTFSAETPMPGLRRMMDAMTHRGPDDEGSIEVKLADDGLRLALGFRRLAVLDLSPLAHQPLLNERTGDVLVFNGEIYNFREIRTRLAANGIATRSTGDSEVLLNALSLWGDKALDMLDGMFAFAFFEARSRRLLLARDPLGIKPLYVASGSWGFAFASEVRALIASRAFSSELDPAGIASFFAYGSPQDPGTVHLNVRSVPAGSCSWVTIDQRSHEVATSSRRYWDFPPVDDQNPPESLIHELREVVEASVVEQCSSDVPVGIFLSGGLDSSLIASIATRHLRDLRSVSFGADESRERDETQSARDTAEMLGLNHQSVRLDNPSIRELWSEWSRGADRPSIDGLNTLIVSKAIANHGIVVAMSGLGADELFGGYQSFAEVRRLRGYLSPATFLPQGASFRKLSEALVSRSTTAKRLLISGGSFFGMALALRRITFDGDLHKLGFDRRLLGLDQYWLPEGAIVPRGGADDDDFRAVSQVESSIYLGNTLLRDADWSSMSHSIELRVPFLSRKVIEFASKVPGKIHFPPGPPRKWLLRAAASHHLPKEMVAREKLGFHLPLNEWIKQIVPDMATDLADATAECSFLNKTAVRRLWQQWMRNPSEANLSQRLATMSLGGYLQSLRP